MDSHIIPHWHPHWHWHWYWHWQLDSPAPTVTYTIRSVYCNHTCPSRRPLPGFHRVSTPCLLRSNRLAVGQWCYTSDEFSTLSNLALSAAETANRRRSKLYLSTIAVSLYATTVLLSLLYCHAVPSFPY